MKKGWLVFCAAALLALMLVGCGKTAQEAAVLEPEPEAIEATVVLAEVTSPVELEPEEIPEPEPLPEGTEILLFGVRGSHARTLDPGRSQVNLIRAKKREHSRKPDEMIDLIERCSPGPYLELFARGSREGWTMWGNQANETYQPDWPTYKNAVEA